MRNVIRRTALSLALGFGLIGSASAATTTLNGLHTTFSFDDALVGLFGMPSVSGDTIFFTPTSFSAKAKGVSDIAFTNATLNVTVSAKQGYVLKGIDLTEQGDYWLYRPLGTGDLGADVSGQIRVRNLATLAEVTDGIVATAPLTTVGSKALDWTANADTSFSAWQSTGVNLTIENLLVAYTDTTKPSIAFIEKKYVGAGVLVTAVPEPGTYAMFLAGLGMLGMVARRRMK